LSLIGSPLLAAEDQEKLDSVVKSAHVLKDAIEMDLKPRDIVTRKSIWNAVATGESHLEKSLARRGEKDSWEGLDLGWRPEGWRGFQGYFRRLRIRARGMLVGTTCVSCW
jgi:hypothetical protein